MGSLRTIFAISVVFAHSNVEILVGGRSAVQLFYIISGFLISYVLTEGKAYRNLRSFYVNRALRLAPIYLAVATLSLAALLVARFWLPREPEFFRVYAQAPASAIALLTLSNLILLFQDWIMFLGVQANQLVFSSNFHNSEVPLWRGLLVPQAWTLGVELSFYLVAPFLLPRRKALFAALAASVAIRSYLLWIGLGTADPWTYRFFPAELALFLIGALAHQVLLPAYRRILSPVRLDVAATYATWILILVILGFGFVPLGQFPKSVLLFTGFSLLLPLAFIFNSRRGWDKWIGDLSYPIYISHLLVISCANLPLRKLGLDQPILLGVIATFFSVLLSLALNRYVAGPVEALRVRVRGGKQA